MIGRIWNAYRAELYKAVRSPGFYVGPALVLLAVFALAIYTAFWNQSLGYPFIALATASILDLPLLLLMLVFGATAVSSELHSGTVRLVAIRPLRRADFLAAKWLLVFSYGLLLTLLAAAGAWGIASATTNIAGLVIGGEVIFTGVEMQRAYLLGLVATLAPLAACASYGVLLSVLIPNPGAATAVAVGGWLLVDLVKYPLHIESVFFWTHWGVPWEYFNALCNGLPTVAGDAIPQCILVSALTVVACAGGAVAVLRRRSL